MNFDRPRVPIGGGKTIDTTREVIEKLDAHIPPKQKTLLLSLVISDFADALDRNPAYIIKQFYDRLFGKSTMHFMCVDEQLLRSCLEYLEGDIPKTATMRHTLASQLKELLNEA